MRRCRSFANFCIAVLLLLPEAAVVRGQSPYMPAYQGMQPDLVEGIQDGLATGKPKIRHVYLAARDVLAVVVHAQAIPRLPVHVG